MSNLSLTNGAPKEKTGAVCGVDLGLKDFAITSDGINIIFLFYENNKN
jgi:transposase